LAQGFSWRSPPRIQRFQALPGAAASSAPSTKLEAMSLAAAAIHGGVHRPWLLLAAAVAAAASLLAQPVTGEVLVADSNGGRLRPHGRQRHSGHRAEVKESLASAPVASRQRPAGGAATAVRSSQAHAIAGAATSVSRHAAKSPALASTPQASRANAADEAEVAGDAATTSVADAEARELGSSAKASGDGVVPEVGTVQLLGRRLTEVKQNGANVRQLQEALAADVALLREGGALRRVSASHRSRVNAELQVHRSEALVRDTDAMLRESKAAAMEGARAALREAADVRHAADALAAEAEEQLRVLAPGAPAAPAAPAAPEAAAAPKAAVKPSPPSAKHQSVAQKPVPAALAEPAEESPAPAEESISAEARSHLLESPASAEESISAEDTDDSEDEA